MPRRRSRTPTRVDRVEASPEASAPPALSPLASSPLSPPRNPSDPLAGVTFDGKRFEIPAAADLPDTLHLLLQCRDLPTLFTWACIVAIVFVGLPHRMAFFNMPEVLSWPALDGVNALAASLGLPGGLTPYPAYATLLVFAFWRLMYNLGLGLMLRWQSKTQFLTRWVEATDEAPTLLSRFTAHCLKSTLRVSPAEVQDIPAPLRSWLIARYFINWILPCDCVAFVVVAFKYCDMEFCGYSPSTCVSMTFSTVAGFSLVAASLRAKVSANEALGAHSFAWFYGDFFFLLDLEVTFSGIFELFPHPMYSAGYGWLYGAALVSRSYAVMAVALLTHFCQMGFLVFFETPHIEKTYGKPESPGGNRVENVYLWRNFSLFRSSDALLLVAFALMVAGAVLGIAFNTTTPAPQIRAAALMHAAFWKVVAFVVIGVVLMKQSATQFWTKHFLVEGRTREEAFTEWCRLCNTLKTLELTSFLIAAAVSFRIPEEYGLDTPRFWAEALAGVALCGLTYYGFSSSLDVIGDFGWFWGDFFVDGPTHSYVGVYRYLNNPDILLGPLYLYGIALICHAPDLALIGVLSHVASFVLVSQVEQPFLKQRYGTQLREGTPATRRIKAELRSLVGRIKARTLSAERNLKQLRRRIRNHLKTKQ